MTALYPPMDTQVLMRLRRPSLLLRNPSPPRQIFCLLTSIGIPSHLSYRYLSASRPSLQIPQHLPIPRPQLQTMPCHPSCPLSRKCILRSPHLLPAQHLSQSHPRCKSSANAARLPLSPRASSRRDACASRHSLQNAGTGSQTSRALASSLPRPR